MVARIEKTQTGYAIPLTEEMLEALQLHEGASVEVLPIQQPEEGQRPQVQYASVEEVMKIHHEMEPRHALAYQELAK